MEISSEWGRMEVVNSLAQGKSKQELIQSLQLIGLKGEWNAAQHGYVGDVVPLLRHPDPDVVTAALEALGNMGEEGSWYSDDIVLYLGAESSKVRAAAVSALGMFGKTSILYEERIAKCLEDKAEEVRASSIAALGQVGAEERLEPLSKFLNDRSPVIAAAACQAMGAFNVAAEAYGDVIAKKLEDATLRSAAISSLSNLGANVTEKHMDDIIARCLEDTDSITRQTAATTLGAIGSAVLSKPASLEKIATLLKSESIGVRCNAALSLGYIGEAAAAPCAAAVAELLSDPEEDSSELHRQVGGGAPRLPPASRRPKCAALIALGMMRAGSFAKDCAKSLSDDNYEVRLCAIECISGMGEDGRACSNDICGCLEDENFYVRMKACECIGSLKAEDAMLQLPERFDDPSPSVRSAALWAVMESPEALDSFSSEIFKCLQDPVPAVKSVAITALSWMGAAASSYASVIATFLGDQDGGVRSAACDALSRMGARGAAYSDEIEALCGDDNPTVANAAAKALEDMGENGAWDEEAQVAMLGDGE